MTSEAEVGAQLNEEEKSTGDVSNSSFSRRNYRTHQHRRTYDSRMNKQRNSMQSESYVSATKGVSRGSYRKPPIPKSGGNRFGLDFANLFAKSIDEPGVKMSDLVKEP